jgi:hypothetical protein
VVDEVKALVKGPLSCPHHRLREVGIALAVDKGKPQDPQAEAFAFVERAQRVLGRDLARRVRPGRVGPILLAGGPAPPWAVHEVGARKYEPRDAGLERPATELERGISVDSDRSRGPGRRALTHDAH